MKGCQKITMLISSAQDSDLSRLDAFMLGAHLKICRHCRKYADSLDQIRMMMDSYADLAELQPSDVQSAERTTDAEIRSELP